MLKAPHVSLDTLRPDDLLSGIAYVNEPDYALLMQRFLEKYPDSVAHIPGFWRSRREKTGSVFKSKQKGFDPEKHGYLDRFPFINCPFPNLIFNRELREDFHSITQVCREFCEKVLEKVKPHGNFGNSACMVRHLYYPATENPEEKREMGPHCDTSIVTALKFLLPGLKGYVDGEWQELEPPGRDEILLMTGAQYGGNLLPHMVSPLEYQRTVLAAFYGKLFAPSLISGARDKIAELQLNELLKI